MILAGQFIVDGAALTRLVVAAVGPIVVSLAVLFLTCWSKRPSVWPVLVAIFLEILVLAVILKGTAMGEGEVFIAGIQALLAFLPAFIALLVFLKARPKP